jgi:hypothetical protein
MNIRNLKFTLSVFILLFAGSILAQSPGSGKILITEFMAINNNTLADGDGDYPDWIELYNPGVSSIDLGGWFLTDNPGIPDKWEFPSITLEPGSYMVVFASGKDRRDPAADLHTSFSLSGSGEYLAIVEPDALTVSYSYGPVYPAQRADVSYGIISFQQTYLSSPTPGAENTTGGQLLPPVFSKNRGFYREAFQVELSVADPALGIYYSTDGTRPSKTKGQRYETPVQIRTTTPLSAVTVNAEGGMSEVITHTYLFVDSIIKQPVYPPGYPPVWGNFKYVSPDPPADYEMDPEVCKDPAYKNLLEIALTSLPTLSIVTDIGNLFSGNPDPLTGGIYIYTGNSAAGSTGKDWERQVSAEYFDPSGSRQFQVNCGLRLHGGNSRVPDNSQKHSLRLVFRSEFGPTRLNFNLFKGRGAANEFNTLVLRAGYNFSWSHNNAEQRERSLLIRDPFAKNTQLDMGSPSAHSRYVHLYLNGLYWGIYTITEKLNNDFMGSYLSGSEDEFDVVKDHGGLVDGNATAWDQTLSQARGGLETQASYQKIQGNNPEGTPNPGYSNLLDVDNLIDYMMFNIWIGNNDWDHNNWIAARNRVDPLYGFYFFSWDAENSMTDIAVNMVGENNDNNPSMIYSQLRANEEFRLRFADRIQKHFFNGGALTQEATLNRFRELAGELDMAIIAESARWGDYRRDLHPRDDVAELYTRNDHWLVEKQALENDYFPQRSTIVLEQFREAGLYPDLDAPVISPHGGLITQPIAIEITAAEGEIYYSLDGADPREPGGAVSLSHAILYESPISTEASVIVRARARNGNTWSAMNEAIFSSETGTLAIPLQPDREKFFALCYPNPFRQSTTIRYILPNGGKVRISVMNLEGRIVADLQSGYQPEGEHSLTWSPEGQPAGIYFYRICLDDRICTGKMILNR